MSSQTAVRIAGVGAAVLAATLTVPALAHAQSGSSAYALSASGTSTIPATGNAASVQSPDGAIRASNLRASSSAGRASASVGSVSLGKTVVASNVAATCADAQGSVTAVGGAKAPGAVERIGAVTVTYNIQTRDSNGRLTVVGARAVMSGQTVTMAVVSCRVEGTPPPTSSPKPGPKPGTQPSSAAQPSSRPGPRVTWTRPPRKPAVPPVIIRVPKFDVTG